MKIGSMFLGIGLVLLIAGIYISSLLNSGWVIIGTFMAVIGGSLMGLSTYFFSRQKRGHG